MSERRSFTIPAKMAKRSRPSNLRVNISCEASPKQTRKNGNGQIGTGGGRRVSFVSNSVFLTATWIAAICGGIGVGAAFFSPIIGFLLTKETLNQPHLNSAKT